MFYAVILLVIAAYCVQVDILTKINLKLTRHIGHEWYR